MLKGQRKRGVQKFDPEFLFLLELDPALEGWRTWAAEWWASPKRRHRNFQAGLTQFLVHYLHGHGLHTLPPAEFFATGKALPDLYAAMGFARLRGNRGALKHDGVSDFLDWVLRTKLTEPDADGHLMVPAHLVNPFPRRTVKKHGKASDLTFIHVLTLDPRLDAWRQLAAEWLPEQKKGVAHRRQALDRFLIAYLHGHDLERNPVKFLLRETPKPDFAKVLVDSKTRGAEALASSDVKHNNHVADFLDWVLTEKLGDDDTGEWDRSRFHNPVERLSLSGMQTNTESNKTALSIRYIKELRGLLVEGRHFGDWKWAQQAMETGNTGGDWFVVNEMIINRNDPDCVWRKRKATRTDLEKTSYLGHVFELWSPVRAVALYIKLELPLRTFQVRLLDSGEADTWRYVHGPLGGKFVLNNTPLAMGSEKRPSQRGVFHRSSNETGAGLYINTNKTADSNKAENEKGYVIPWAHEEVLYWLEKLRNWQERYNPIKEPTRWADLETKHFGRTPPHPEVLEQRGTASFLFRDPTDAAVDKPLDSNALKISWFRLLAKLEKKCLARGETLDDGTPLHFVVPNSYTGTYFPLHALRVSLISYLIMDLNLPIAVVSKLIAGHASIIMTLYYTKFGKAYMREVLDDAEKRMLEADQGSHRRFLMDATVEQITQQFASLSEDAARAAIQNKSAAAFVFEDKGICPVGGMMCDAGGEQIGGGTANRATYAPVPGYPLERNCVRCRFFLTGPAWVPAMAAHFNTLSEKAHRQSGRYRRMETQQLTLEDLRFDCERNNIPFVKAKELERLSQRVEAEKEAVAKLANDMEATYYLIGSSLEKAQRAREEGVQIVVTSNISDLEVALIEADSPFHLQEVVCENAVIYAETDASFVSVARGQLLDRMLRYNSMDPIFMYLTPEQQLLIGNAVMELIKARTGSIRGALPYAECHAKLKEIGALKDVQNLIAQASVGTPAKELFNHVRAKRALKPHKED